MPGLAVLGNADDRDNAGADLLLAVVNQALQILGLDAFDRAGEQLDAAGFAHAAVRRCAIAGAAAHRELLARLRQIALQLLSFFHQRRNTRRHVVDGGAQFGRGGFRHRHGVIDALSGMTSGQRLDAPYP